MPSFDTVICGITPLAGGISSARGFPSRVFLVDSTWQDYPKTVLVLLFIAALFLGPQNVREFRAVRTGLRGFARTDSIQLGKRMKDLITICGDTVARRIITRLGEFDSILATGRLVLMGSRLPSHRPASGSTLAFPPLP